MAEKVEDKKLDTLSWYPKISENNRRVKKLELDFGPITEKNIEQLKILNDATFPVRYSPSFYQKATTYAKYSRMAYFNDYLIGAMTCREEMRDNQNTVYILTIGVLNQYRRYGIGSMLLEELMKISKIDPSIKAIYLHMQVGNDSGLAFYKKHGFEVAQKIENYYEDLNPRDCYLLKKNL